MTVHTEKWRAQVGRLPFYFERDFARLSDTHGSRALYEAIWTVAKADLRRTRDRICLLYSTLGEKCPLGRRLS